MLWSRGLLCSSVTDVVVQMVVNRHAACRVPVVNGPDGAQFIKRRCLLSTSTDDSTIARWFWVILLRQTPSKWCFFCSVSI